MALKPQCLSQTLMGASAWWSADVGVWEHERALLIHMIVDVTSSPYLIGSHPRMVGERLDTV